MEHIYISKALLELRPEAQWSLLGDDYSGIEWMDTEQTIPTEEELVKKIEEVKYREEVEEYKLKRAAEYPPYSDQFDKIYHSGVNAWKAEIKAIKDKYPKQQMDADELKKREDKAIFDFNVIEYSRAKERLSIEAEPLEETIEVPTDGPGGEVSMLSIDNPLLVKDKEEREAAQKIIDSASEEVIEAYNSALQV